MASGPNELVLTRGTTRYVYRLAKPMEVVVKADQLPLTAIGLPNPLMQEAVWPVRLNDFSGGLSRDKVDGREPTNEYWYNYGWDTRFPNVLQLWPEATLLTTITATDAPPATNGRQGSLLTASIGTTEGYSLFAQYGDRVVEIASPTAASPTVTQRLDHSTYLVALQKYYRDTAGALPRRVALIAAQAVGSPTSWQRSDDGAVTWAAWSPGGAGDDPDNDNPFIIVPPSDIYWIHSTGTQWVIEKASTPSRSDAGLITQRTIIDDFLLPRMLGVGLDAAGALAARWTEVEPRNWAGLANDALLSPQSMTGWNRHEVYSYKTDLMFVNPAQTPQATIPEGPVGGIVGSMSLQLWNLGILPQSRRSGESVSWRMANALPQSVSRVISMDKGEGLPSPWKGGFILASKSRPDALYFLLEESTSEQFTVNPDGTQITWLFEAVAQNLSIHPIARVTGAVLPDGLVVTAEYVYFMVKTASSPIVAPEAKVYRVNRAKSPGIRGTDSFEGFAPKAAQFTAANSEWLSVVDNAALSMGDIDMAGGCFVYLDSLPTAGNTMGIMGKTAAGNLEYWLFVDNTGGTVRFKFSVRDTGDTTTTTVTATTFGTPSTATWYFVQFYHDATANTIGVAVNNGAFNTAATSGGVRNGTAAFEIGRHTGGNYLNGRVDTAFITKEVLSAAEWTYLYNSGTGIGYRDVYADLRTNLQAWWELEEAAGTRRDWHGSNSLLDNNTVTNADGISSGPVARLELPWLDFGWPMDAGTLYHFKAQVGTFTNMTLRVKYQLDYSDVTYTAGSLTAAGTFTVSANSSFKSIRFILEAWRSTGTTATDTLVLPSGVEAGVYKEAPPRKTVVGHIDQEKTRELRGGAVTHGRLLTEMIAHRGNTVSIEWDGTTHSNLRVDIVSEASLIDEPYKGRKGEYVIVMHEVVV